MFEYKHMEEYNQWIRYQRMNHQKHQLKRKCVTHNSAVTPSTIIFFDLIVLIRWHLDTEREMLFVIGTQWDPWIPSKSYRKPHSYLSLQISSKCLFFFFFSFLFFFYISLCIPKRIQRGTIHSHWLASTQSLNRATATPDALTHALNTQFEWRRFVYFAAVHVVVWSYICEISLVDRWVFTLVRLSLADVTYLIHKQIRNTQLLFYLIVFIPGARDTCTLCAHTETHAHDVYSITCEHLTLGNVNAGQNSSLAIGNSCLELFLPFFPRNVDVSQSWILFCFSIISSNLIHSQSQQQLRHTTTLILIDASSQAHNHGWSFVRSLRFFFSVSLVKIVCFHSGCKFKANTCSLRQQRQQRR